MWRNRHVVTALLVAPVLALIAYFSVDSMLSPNAEVLIEGRSYPLKEHSNCRRAGGVCTLSNNELRVQLVAEFVSGKLAIGVQLEQQADQVLLALLSESGRELGPFVLSRENGDLHAEGSRFYSTLDSPEKLSGLRVVVVVRGAKFFASPTAAFLKLEP